MGSRRWRRQHEVLVERALTERAAHLFRRFGHGGLPLKVVGTSLRRGVTTPVPGATRILLRSDRSSDSCAWPGSFDQVHQDPSACARMRQRPPGSVRPRGARSCRLPVERDLLPSGDQCGALRSPAAARPASGIDQQESPHRYARCSERECPWDPCDTRCARSPCAVAAVPRA